jgi:hypothetical protein
LASRPGHDTTTYRGARCTSRAAALPGSAFPLGATVRDSGTNFAAEAAAAMLARLFDGTGAEN